MRKDLKETLSKRASILLALIVVFLTAVFLKFGYVMLMMDSGDSKVRLTNELQNRPQLPRGEIVDTNGNLLATSVEKKSLVANPQEIKNPHKTARKLSQELSMTSEKLAEKLDNKRYFVWLKRKLASEKYLKLRSMDLDGVYFEDEYERVYPKGRSGASVLGFVGVDNRGLAGIEKEYDQLLVRARDSQNPVKNTGGSNDKNVSIRLTIDHTIQHIVREELLKVVNKESPNDAMVVAMEPETGRIRAMVNWPTYNPNRYRKFESDKRRNRVISDVFEPGSTLKPVTMAIGLADEIFSPSSNFNCNGYVYLPDAKHTIHCHSEHGALSIPEILIESCNVGMVKATKKIPSKKYFTGLRDFGFGSWSGVNLPGEASGALRRPSQWSAMTQSSIAIGQGLSTTALQITNAISVIANDGKLFKPRIIEQISGVEEDSRETDKFKIRRVIPKKIARDMKRYMEKVVDEGTGKQAKLTNYKVAGKTGTAQKPNRNKGGYYKDKFFASFVGFSPVKDPQLVIGVFLDNPQEHKYGGEVAAPLFRRIMKRSMRYLDRKNKKGGQNLVLNPD